MDLEHALGNDDDVARLKQDVSLAVAALEQVTQA